MAGQSRRSLIGTFGSVLAMIVLAIVGAALYFSTRDGAPEPSPAPTPVTVRVSEIRTVPDVSREKRRDTADELAGALRKLYTRAFTRPLEATPSTPASPSPARRVRDLMTKPAVAALKRSPGVFDLEGLIVTNGEVTFGGVVTFDGKEPVGALLDVDFVGRATPVASTTPVARVHQKGTISLRRTSGRWLVDGFDLRVASRPEPTPSASG